MTRVMGQSRTMRSVVLGMPDATGGRDLPEEVPVAMVYNGSTYAVMMATPGDIVDFATGFALSEQIVDTAAELGEIEVMRHGAGIEARAWLSAERAEAMASRRRMMTGPVGCGLCGIDSLEQALRPITPLPATNVTLAPAEVTLALDELRGWQPLHDQTRAVHAAGFYVPGQGIVMAREDVGRHNALDKLIGALARAGIDGATGAIALTSRISVDMVQKCAVAGAPVLLSVSSPTAHAVELATGAGITVASIARGATHVFSHPDRIKEVPHVI